MAQFIINKLEERKLLAKIKRLSNGFSEMDDFWNKFSALELSSTLLRYKDQEDPDGNPWRDPITIRRDGRKTSSGEKSKAWWYWKRSNFHAIPKGWHFFDRNKGDKVLIDTGILNNSIQNLFGKDWMAIGTNIKYGKHVQNKGFVFLGVNEQTKENSKEAFREYIKGLVK